MSILLSIGSTLLGFVFRAILPYILCFGLGWYCCNQWHHKKEDTHRRIATTTETVLSIDSGTEIQVKAGLLGRRNRTVSLWGIVIPNEVKEFATSNLRSSLNEGDRIEVEVKEGRKIGINDTSGVVTHNGINYNLKQLRDGWATTSVEDKTFIAAQKEAEKAQRGIWQKKKDPKKPHFPWWRDEMIGDTL